jgi:hypothetical protein
MRHYGNTFTFMRPPSFLLVFVVAIGILVAMACESGVNTPARPSGTPVAGDASAAALRQPKIDICHRTGRSSEFILISVAEPAVAAHIAHGDGRVGDPVPGQPGMTFDAACLQVPAAPPGVTAIPLSAFSGNERVVQFGVSTTQPLPYSENGATFVSYTGLAASVLSFNAFLFMAGPGTLTVTFSVPVTRAGFNFVNSFGAATIEAEVFADPHGLQALGHVDLGSFAPMQTGFVGFAADAAFTRADISFAVPATASFFIDDFRFEGPALGAELGTITLGLLGVALIGSRMGRRRTGSDNP